MRKQKWSQCCRKCWKERRGGGGGWKDESVEEDEAQRRGDGDDRSDSEQLKVGFII